MVTDGESHPAPKEAIDTNLSSLVSADLSSSGTIQETSNNNRIKKNKNKSYENSSYSMCISVI